MNGQSEEESRKQASIQKGLPQDLNSLQIIEQLDCILLVSISIGMWINEATFCSRMRAECVCIAMIEEDGYTEDQGRDLQNAASRKQSPMEVVLV